MQPLTPPPRNAITSMSITPFRMKTASIPTSARIYNAIPLNQDLTNELDGATIQEPDRKKPKNHYILLPYNTLPRRTAPEISTLTRDRQPLYDTSSQSWNPAHLPHILRDSSSTSASASTSSLQKAHAGVRNKIGNSAPPFDKPVKERRRRTVITQVYQGLNGPEEETTIGTYLPQAGLEEKTLARWLNHITDSIYTHEPPDAGQSVRTRGSVRRMARRWSADSSTKATPVADTELHLKPDIVLIQPDEYEEVPSKFSWRNVASFLELTSAEYSSRLSLQITKKAYAIFVAQPGRRFLIALSIANLKLRIHSFDRSGVIHSRGYNIHQHPDFVIKVIYTLTVARPEDIGYDPTLSYSTTIARMRRQRVESYIEIDGKRYIIECLLFYSAMIRGRATLCFVVRDPSNGKRYVVKDSWTRSGRMATEEDMLMRIKERGLTFGVPVLEAAWTVHISNKTDSTDLRRPGYIFEKGSSPPETRIHRRLLLESVGVPLIQFSSIQELISIFIDIVDVHERLVALCCILHRDISLNNILMYIFEGTWPALELEGNDARVTEREEIIRKRQFRRGLLIDFDYAKFTDGPTTGPLVGERTGTVPFMAIDILGEYAMQEGTIVHHARHDLESLVYVLVWICVLYGDPREESGPRNSHGTCLDMWTAPKTLQQIQALGVFKRGDLYVRVALREFTDYFQGLKGLVGNLYDALVESYSGRAEFSHATMKKILLDAFFAVEEPVMENSQRFMKRKRDAGSGKVQTTKQPRLQY